ncbi:four-carbon acid sugar kinase family protein [Paracoccus saliphilus]|uniref:Four-carbon acid sugar kinase family protein n=1 Tax=Paracoccus saliphilus TaxID=405559 RepID=A0AA46A652_9RHOB|nr:four-carbon acid sugar kinase family protein [Paracoccus saliphilus]WCR02245.1 four-carbon acid sugar kinase family protein [Paracoccus saliphilus]SIS92580.1 Uncharacterized conserved protein YgbK, DUF1537 family [Paracoccus saliphilus]
MRRPIVFLADDFTGASDSLASYARRGCKTRLLVDTDMDSVPHGLDAVGIATDLRSLKPERAITQIERIWPMIARLSPERLHYKVCSTFDSSPTIGSIGAIASELRARFRPDVMAVIGGQPSLGRYLCFGNLFARDGDGRVHRIDRHPVMSRHPVTPMTEIDLARHLAAQGLDDLDRVTFRELAHTVQMAERLRNGSVIFDVTSEQDQQLIGEALTLAGGRQLLIGASSVAEIIAGNIHPKECEGDATPPGSKRFLAFAGSRSPITAQQVRACAALDVVVVSPDRLADVGLVAECKDKLISGHPVLIALDPETDYTLSPDELADCSVKLIAAILDGTSVGYVCVAGGDTSSRICAGLGFHALEFEKVMERGVSMCVGRHRDAARDRMRLILKGGQMGGTKFFDNALDQVRRS